MHDLEKFTDSLFAHHSNDHLLLTGQGFVALARRYHECVGGWLMPIQERNALCVDKRGRSGTGSLNTTSGKAHSQIKYINRDATDH
jgi:hypothetical protein